jgi:6-phosphogluconolactonase
MKIGVLERPRRARIALLGAISLVVLASLAQAAGAQTANVVNSPGAAYGWTNDPDGNEIVMFDRSSTGLLTPAGSFPTGGLGSGMLENSANGVIIAEQAPNNLNGGYQFLFTVNAGSNSISVFDVRPDGLELVSVAPSGGNHPLSVTYRKRVLYVLNGGNTNCTGGMPNITGFRVGAKGDLTPIPGSTRPVSGGAASGCAQISFNKSGEVLVVTEREADKISTYTVDKNDVANGPIVNETSGVGPFGFTFTQRDQLVTTENFGAAPLQGGAASYEVLDDGTLVPISPTVRNGRSDTCWVVITDNNKFAYITNFQSGDISLYRVEPDGTLVLLNPTEAVIDVGAADLSLSGNSQYLYARNALQGSISAFAVDQTTGQLTRLQDIGGLPPGGAALGGFAAR